MRHNARIGTLRVSNGGTASPGITSLQFGRSGLGMSVGITIYAPAALPEATVVQVLPHGSAVWRNLQSGGVDVAVAAGKAVVISPLPFSDLRLLAAVVAADRDFDIDGQIET